MNINHWQISLSNILVISWVINTCKYTPCKHYRDWYCSIRSDLPDVIPSRWLVDSLLLLLLVLLQKFVYCGLYVKHELVISVPLEIPESWIFWVSYKSFEFFPNDLFNVLWNNEGSFILITRKKYNKNMKSYYIFNELFKQLE